MGLIKGVTIRPLESVKGGMAEFYTPLSSDETMIVKVPANTVDDLFVHKHQTDRLLVVKGSFILVVLYNRHYQYIPLSEHHPQAVTIPPNVLHGAINPNAEDCLLVNALQRHGEASDRDYQPVKRPFPYDLERAKASFKQLNLSRDPLVIA
ncbi:cupin domain-containing protein [Myxosarcina sp. GI1(2024)]